MIQEQRVQKLNTADVDKKRPYVLYWMQQSQRAAGNPALEYAAQQANDLHKPLIVGFGLDASYPEANARHFAFMLAGLAETAEALAKRNIKFVTRLGPPPDVACELAKDAALVVCDRGYLRHQRQWRDALAKAVSVAAVQIEGDVVVPVETASDKREYAARTIRKKLNSRSDDFLQRQRSTSLKKSSLPLSVTGDVDVRDWKAVLDRLDLDREVGPVDRFVPGTAAARKRLTAFIRADLPGYADGRNDPSDPCASELSPYLHFGQISPVEIARKVQRAEGPSSKDKEAYLEELIVRRELACNFVYYADDYDSYNTLPDWALKTLEEHKDDKRPVRYTRAELENGQTDDPYWNAAMHEMRASGYMHNYMRMYWGKKILEWCNTPRYAYKTALYLNNRYFLDGRDANSYANVGWLFGLHDRAWTEREIFGKVRYMNANGLKSKFDIEGYVQRVSAL